MNHCCGVLEIGGLDGSSVRELRKQIQRELEENGPRTVEYRGVGQGTHEIGQGMAVATTIENQTAARRALRLCKFRARYSFRNPNSGNRVTFWIKKLTR
jgi:hypothetical protein